MYWGVSMNTKRFSAWSLWPAFVLVFLLGGCGGSSDSSQAVVPEDPGMGKITLLFTDLPSEDFDHILISFDEVSLLSDAGHQVIYSTLPDAEPMTIDLLSLRQVTEVAFITEVPAGMYSKVRLHLTGIDLVKGSLDDPDKIVIPVDLVANGKLDLNPRGDFEVRSGQMLFIELDIDANRSFQAHESGNGRWHFRPVVFMNIFGDYDTHRLMRVFGEVIAVDLEAAEPTFDLCPVGMISQEVSGIGVAFEYSECIRVYPGDSGVFSPVDGLDQGLAGIEASEPLQQLTMIGYFRSTIDAGPGALSEFDARVIELGAQDAFARLGGMALGSPVDFLAEPGTQVFDWAVGAGQTVPEGTVVTTQLQAKSLVFDSAGNEFVDGAGISQGVTGMVDGIDDGGLFRSSLVLLDALNAGDEQLAGTVAGPIVSGESQSFALITDTTTETVCVSSDAQILKLETLDDGSGGSVITLTPAMFSDITVDQDVEVTGAPGIDGACFAARIVIIDLTAPAP
jgi:hypothetical protein